MAESDGSESAPTESGGPQRVAGAPSVAASSPARLRGDALARDARWLRSSGIIQAYEFVLARLAQRGRPQGNVLQYAADEIENFGRQWSSHLQGMATPRLPIKPVTGWTFLSDLPSVISPGKNKLTPIMSPLNRAPTVGRRRAYGREAGARSSSGATGETVPAETSASAGSQQHDSDASSCWVTGGMGAPLPSAGSGAVHLADAPAPPADDPSPSVPGHQLATDPGLEQTITTTGQGEGYDADVADVGGESAGHNAEGTDSAGQDGDTGQGTAAAGSEPGGVKSKDGTEGDAGGDDSRADAESEEGQGGDEGLNDGRDGGSEGDAAVPSGAPRLPEATAEENGPNGTGEVEFVDGDEDGEMQGGVDEEAGAEAEVREGGDEGEGEAEAANGEGDVGPPGNEAGNGEDEGGEGDVEPAGEEDEGDQGDVGDDAPVDESDGQEGDGIPDGEEEGDEEGATEANEPRGQEAEEAPREAENQGGDGDAAEGDDATANDAAGKEEAEAEPAPEDDEDRAAVHEGDGGNEEQAAKEDKEKAEAADGDQAPTGDTEGGEGRAPSDAADGEGADAAQDTTQEGGGGQGKKEADEGEGSVNGGDGNDDGGSAEARQGDAG